MPWPSRIRRPLRGRFEPRGSALRCRGAARPDLSPPLAWSLIRQAVTAQLRHAFGFDSSQAGLSGRTAAYPKVVAAVHESPAD
jgi:hypothetical protein